MADLIIISLDLLHLEPLIPGVGHQFTLALKVILHMALAADKGPHLLPGGHGIDLILTLAAGLTPAFDTGQVGDRVL
jgi:hypothetical protein